MFSEPVEPASLATDTLEAETLPPLRMVSVPVPELPTLESAAIGPGRAGARPSQPVDRS